MSETFDFKPSSKKLHNYLLSMFVLSLIFAAIMFLAGRQTLAITFGAIALYSLLTRIAFPPAGYIIYYPWIALGWLLAHTVSPLIISLIYYLIVTPSALVMRLSGRDRLNLKKKPEGKTYWQDANSFERQDFERMF